MTAQNNLTLLIIVTVLFVVGVFVYGAFGDVATLVYICIALSVFVGYLLQLSGQLTAVAIVRSTLTAWTDAQAADDRGEVERMKALRVALGHDAKQKPSPEPAPTWTALPPPQTWTPQPLLSVHDDSDDGNDVEIER